MPVSCFPINKSADQTHPPSLALSIPSEALLQAPRIKRTPISAVASVRTSGVLVTAIPLFFAASKSIFPNPTAKFESILTESGY